MPWTVEEIAATLDRLAGEGIEPERPPYTVREGGPLICFVPDPDGNRSVANCAESGLFPGTLAAERLESLSDLEGDSVAATPERQRRGQSEWLKR